MDIHFWYWGLRFHLGRLSGGLFIHDGFNFNRWGWSIGNFPPAGACLKGIFDLHFGPLVLVWTK